MTPSEQPAVLYSFPHPVGRPGIGTTALQQVRALSLAGARVTLVCTSLHAAVPASVHVVETLRFGGQRLPHRALGRAQHAANYHDWRAARVLSRGDFDVVHAWPGAALATFACARSGGVLASREVPNTHTAHAMCEAEREAELVGVSLPDRNSHRRHEGRLRVEEQEYAEADLLLLPSDHVRETFLAHGVPETRVARHHYGFDEGLFHARGRTESPERPFTALFVGSVEPRKGLHYALDAWSRCAPEGGRFQIAGRFMPGYGERLGRLLDQPGVEVLHFVDDVPALLRDGDVLLLPSVEEGSALVTYEAQASGCLPLASVAAGAVLPVGVNDDLIHPTRDVGVLAGQLARLSRDESRRAELRATVIECAGGITWRAAGERMLEVWAEALSEPALEGRVMSDE